MGGVRIQGDRLLCAGARALSGVERRRAEYRLAAGRRLFHSVGQGFPGLDDRSGRDFRMNQIMQDHILQQMFEARRVMEAMAADGLLDDRNSFAMVRMQIASFPNKRLLSRPATSTDSIKKLARPSVARSRKSVRRREAQQNGRIRF